MATPLMVARAERDEARSLAGLQSRLLHDLVAGRPPDATAKETRSDGWAVEGQIYRCQSGEGGLLLVVNTDSLGNVANVSPHFFEAWRDALAAAPSDYNTADRIVAERLGAARWAIWEGPKVAA